jgi:hypothetical protein
MSVSIDVIDVNTFTRAILMQLPVDKVLEVAVIETIVVSEL